MTKDFPLVIFTLLQQMAAGGFILLALLLIKQQLNQASSLQLSRRLIVVLILSGLALATSTLHLGHPLRGANVLLGLGRSWLSNEVIITGTFFGSVGFYWLASWKKQEWVGLRKLSLVVGLLSGLAGLAAMSLTYMIYTVPVWDSWHTPAGFFATAATAGALLALLLVQPIEDFYTPKIQAGLHFVGLLGLLACTIVMGMQAAHWAGISTSVTTPAEQFAGYSSWMTTRAVLLLAAGILWLATVLKDRITPISLLATLLLVLAAEGAGRVIYYSVHMTVGL